VNNIPQDRLRIAVRSSLSEAVRLRRGVFFPDGPVSAPRRPPLAQPLHLSAAQEPPGTGGEAEQLKTRGERKAHHMNEQEFNAKLANILQRIEHLPPQERQRVQKLAEETRQRHQRMRQTVGQLQESLDYLRLSVKYLVFDLEATRRGDQASGEDDAA